MKGIVVALLIAIIAAVANPDTDDFKRHVGAQVRAEFMRETRGQDTVAQALGAFAGTIAQEFAGFTVDRINFVVCSLYELDAPGMRGKWLGVFGNFIPLQ